MGISNWFKHRVDCYEQLLEEIMEGMDEDQKFIFLNSFFEEGRYL